MGLILGIFLGLILWTYWTALILTIFFCWSAFWALASGRFIRGAIYGCLAMGMITWWYHLGEQDGLIAPLIPSPDGVYAWVTESAQYIGFAIACVLLYKYKMRRQAIADVPPFGVLPGAEGNVVPFVHATRQEKERVMTIQDHRCANPYCNADLRDSVPHWDHITPRSKGGTDSVHNGQWLCDTCNMNKGDQGWLEFLFRYATRMGQDPSANQKPWKKWVLTRTQNGLQCQG